MYKMNCSASDLCWHGCGMTGTLIHLLWQCPEVKNFWGKIKDALCQTFKVNFQLCPAVAILGGKMWRVYAFSLLLKSCGSMFGGHWMCV
uniref:Uncharacterized protein n=1 Tax=Neogobius melanostomus TaxID=47308 RepID=A0A8C6U1Z1_9GOBI